MTEWALRAFAPEDGRAVGAVLVAAGVEAWGDWLGADRVVEANRDRTHPADLVAVDAEGICGFVAWDTGTGEVTRLYTHPRVWGLGVGRALLAAALEALAASGLAEVWLRTEERNQRARAFYELQGWRNSGEIMERDWHGAHLREVRYIREP